MLEDVWQQRHGDVPQRLARDLIGRQIGERLPRVHDYAANLRVGNSTIQAGMQYLQNLGAVELISRGHLGTFIRCVNHTKLWEIAGVGTVACAMPLPYSRRFEGLATGLSSAFREAEIPFGLAFVRGANSRLRAIVSGRCELAVVSHLAAEHCLAAGQPVTIGARLGPRSYLDGHVLLWSGRPVEMFYPKGLRVGYDPKSLDQLVFLDVEFAGLDIQRVPITYNQMHIGLQEGKIDVAPYNADEVRPEWNLTVTPPYTRAGRALLHAGSEAVLLVHAARPEVSRLLADVIQVETITSVQSGVLAGQINPSF